MQRRAPGGKNVRAATPSEAAGVGAMLCLMLAIVIYRMWRIDDIWPILCEATRESRRRSSAIY